MQTAHKHARGVVPRGLHRSQLGYLSDSFGFERAVARPRKKRRRSSGFHGRERRDFPAVSFRFLLFFSFIWRRTAFELDAHFASSAFGPEFAPHGLQRRLRLRYTYWPWEEEPCECLIEDADVVKRPAQNGSERVAHGELVGEVHDLKRSRSVVQFAGTNLESILAAQEVAECDQIPRKAAERVHQERGVETEPKPKSATTRDSTWVGATARTGSIRS